MLWCCTPLRASLLASAPAAVCRVPAAGVGGRTELRPSQASRAAADKLSYWNLRGPRPPREGSQVQLPRLLVTQEPLCLT